MAASRCKGCGANIIWAVTVAGKRVPLDAKCEQRFLLTANEGPENEVELRHVYTSHFITCPKANEFRKAPGNFAGTKVPKTREQYFDEIMAKEQAHLEAEQKAPAKAKAIAKAFGGKIVEHTDEPVEFPREVKCGGTILTLREVDHGGFRARYHIDHGAWGVWAEWRDGKLYSLKYSEVPDYLKCIELFPQPEEGGIR